MHSHRVRTVIILLVLLVPAWALATEGVRPTPEAIAALRVASDVRLSPDGRWLAYTLATADLDSAAKPSDDDTKGGWTRSRQIWLVDAEGGSAPRQLTRGTERAGSPRWSPDGQSIAFLRAHGGKQQLHVLRLDGGDAERIGTGDLEPQSPGWSPDGKELAFLAPVPHSETEKAEKWRTGGVVAWDTEWRSAQLWIVPRSGGEPRRVTQGTENVVEWAWSPDGRRFVIVTSRTADPYEVFNLLRVRVVDARDGVVLHTLEDRPRAASLPRWSPDGRSVAWLTAEESLSLLNVLRVTAVDGSGARNAAPALEHTFASFLWAPDGKSLVAVVRERTRTKLYRFPSRGGKPRDLGFVGRVIDGNLDTSRDGRRLAFLSSTDHEPNDPTVFDLSDRAALVAVRLNPQVAEWTLGSQAIFRWKNPEGSELEGLLTWPPQAPADQPVPLLVMPHGGPDDVTQERFSAMTLYFASRGYAVFRPNYRGGTAYGQAFYQANRGRLGEIEYMDIESGVDALIAAGKADPGQLYYGGWSWGGYLTAWTIGHTTRYRAAVVGAAVNDVVLSYVLSDVNHGVAAAWEYKGDPWRQPENFERANPMRFVAKVKTPTLVLHGDADERVPFQQGILFYRALRDLEVPVEFYAYPREPHGIGEPAHVAHRLRVWGDWYDRHRGTDAGVGR